MYGLTLVAEETLQSDVAMLNNFGTYVIFRIRGGGGIRGTVLEERKTLS